MTVANKKIDPKNPIVHYFMGGRTGCGQFERKRPSEWLEGHMWSIYWKDVTCRECLRANPK